MNQTQMLVVDDREDNIYLLTALLQGNGYGVVTAANGAEALEKARQNTPDLVIADILMPVMDGFTLCREWRKDGQLAAVPFIFYTATYTDGRDREFALSLGADRFVIKPAEPDELLAIVRELLAQPRGAPAAPPAGGGHPSPLHAPPAQNDSGFLKQYNEALVRKLEAKMAQLEQANRDLERDILARKKAEEESERVQAQLVQAQKMESVGRLAGGVAHDFNNMLQIITGHTEMALEQIAPDSPIRADLMEILAAAYRSVDLTRQLLAFARKQVAIPKVLDLNKTVEGTIKMLRRLIGEDIALEWIPGDNLWLTLVDPAQMDQVLANLLVNARDAIGGVGRIFVETANASIDGDYCAGTADAVPGDYVMLAVSDDGCGMDKDTLARLFEPFFTTKDLGKGTGLGLAMVYGIIKQNNGFINVYSEPENGATFRLYLPRHIGEGEQADNHGGSVPVARGDETILLVEDEPAILGIAQKMLESLGYLVLAAPRPGEAIRIASAHPGEIHLLLTDLVMPEMDGGDLAKHILALRPRIKLLFASGYTGSVIARKGALIGDGKFIEKPFSIQALAAKVREALDTR